MWLRQRQLDLLLLLFFIIFIIVMIGHDSVWPFFLGLSMRLRWRQRRHSDLLLLHMIFTIITIGHDSGLSSSCIRRWRGQHPAC